MRCWRARNTGNGGGVIGWMSGVTATGTDPVGGVRDAMKDGVARAFDKELDAPTWLYAGGDEKHPVKDEPMAPELPAIISRPLKVEQVTLPVFVTRPGLRESESPTEPPMNLDFTPWRTGTTSPTFTRPFCINWGWIRGRWLCPNASVLSATSERPFTTY